MRYCGFAIVLVVLSAVGISLVGCGDDDGTSGCSGCVDNTDFAAEETFYERIEFAGQARLRLDGISGNIVITGIADSDSIIVSGTRRVLSESTEDAEDHLPLLDVSIRDLTTEVAVRTQQPSRPEGRSYEVDYEIVLPAGMGVAVSNVNGTITVDDLTATVEVANVNGQIVVRDIFGSVYAAIVNGQISGEVTLPLDGTIEMDVTNGIIDLEIPVDTSAEFYASKVYGEINILGNLDLHDTQITNMLVTGTLGAGEGDIRLTVVTGVINVVGF
jgi:hypothetical protein